MRTASLLLLCCARVIPALLLLDPAAVSAQDEPRPPCGAPPQPAYAEIGAQPEVRILSGKDLAAWAPAACTRWQAGEGDLLVALAGSFYPEGGHEGIERRFGSVSRMSGLRYWSVTDKAWRVLITAAEALEGPDPDLRRRDFAAAELKVGADLYFAQQDSRSTGEVVYRMRVRESSADRLVVEMENVTPVRFLLLPIFKPGGMKTLYFLERRPNGAWGYYALVLASSPFTQGNEASFVNRAVALYRHFIGVPADGAPPLVP